MGFQMWVVSVMMRRLQNQNHKVPQDVNLDMEAASLGYTLIYATYANQRAAAGLNVHMMDKGAESSIIHTVPK